MAEFDKAKEKELLKILKKSANNPFDRHFAYIGLQDFYYKYRDLDIKYLNLCEKYCLKDIETIGIANQDYISKEVAQINKYIDIRGNLTNDLKEINQIKSTGFNGYIPAFKRLTIIEEKRGNYDKAIMYCDMAINWYENIIAGNTLKNLKNVRGNMLPKKDKLKGVRTSSYPHKI